MASVRYVRPDTSHNTVRDGLTYETAWGGRGEIVYGSGNFGDNTDLYICGNHTISGGNWVLGTHGASSVATSARLRGDYPGDPGSLTFSGNSSLFIGQRYTHVMGLTMYQGTAPCLQLNQSAKDFKAYLNTIVGGVAGTNKQLVQLYTGGANTTHERIEFFLNEFRDVTFTAATGEGSAIDWFLTTASQAATLTGLYVYRNTFRRILSGRAIIGLRPLSTTDVSSVMDDIRIEDNLFEDCGGLCVDVATERDSADLNGSLVVRRNRVWRNALAAGSGSIIGGFVLARGWLDGRIEHNEVHGLLGDAGFADVFYGSYRVDNNVASDLQGVSIDGSGVLFDHGCHDSQARGNVFYDIGGIDGIWYSGACITVLDATNIDVSGNVGHRVNIGVVFGSSLYTGVQSAKVHNNAFSQCAFAGVSITQDAIEAGCQCYNNIFTGVDGAIAIYEKNTVSWSLEDNNLLFNLDAPVAHTLGSSDLTSDPLFIDETKPWLGLRPGSPCRSAGVYVPGARDRFDRSYLEPHIGPWALLDREAA